MKRLSELLETISAKQAEIDGHGKLNDQLAKRIQHKFRLDWNYYSNAMEGNLLTKIETKQLMMDNVTINGKPFKDVAEMRGHDNEVLEIFKIGKGQTRISEKRIKQMHIAIIHEEDPEKKAFIGQWKNSDNYLINYRGEKFNFLPFAEVPSAMHDLLNKTNAEIDAIHNNKANTKHPALIAFEFHLRYLEIHPFYDGNGRTGRLLLNLILISFGFPPVILDEHNRSNYYRILAEVQGYGLNPEECYCFLAELLIRSQNLVLDAINGKEIEDEDDWKKDITLWKQTLASEDQGVVKRSDELKFEIYTSSLKPLFLAIIKESKIFDDLFVEKQIQNGMDNYSFPVTDIDLFDQWAAYIKPSKKKNSKGAMALFVNTENLAAKVAALSILQERYKNVNFDANNDLRFEINFIGFKHNKTKVFDQSIGLLVQFERFRYVIMDRFKREPFFEKLYSEQLSKEEIDSLVKTLLITTRKEIEQRINPTTMNDDALHF